MSTLKERLSKLASDGNYKKIAEECVHGELREELLLAARSVTGPTGDAENAVGEVIAKFFPEEGEEGFAVDEPSNALAELTALVREVSRPNSLSVRSYNADVNEFADNGEAPKRRPEAHEWCKTGEVVYLAQHCPEVLPELAVRVIRILNQLDENYARHVTPLVDGKATLYGQRLMAKYLDTSPATITRKMAVAKERVEEFYYHAAGNPNGKEAAQLASAVTSHDLKTQFESTRFVPPIIKDILSSRKSHSTVSACQLLAAAVMMDYDCSESDKEMKELIDAAGRELDRLQSIHTVLRARHLETLFREAPKSNAEPPKKEIDAVIDSLKQISERRSLPDQAPDDLTVLCWLHEGILERLRANRERAAAVFLRAKRISGLPLDLRASLTHQQAVLAHEDNRIARAIKLYAETLRYWDAFDRKAASQEDKRRSQHRRIYTFRRLANCLALQAEQRKHAKKRANLRHAAKQFERTFRTIGDHFLRIS